jgi:hypothetical protein
VEAAMAYARENLAPYKEKSIPTVSYTEGLISIIDVVGLLCYEDPFNSVLSSLLDDRQRDLTASVVNAEILKMEDESEESRLELMYRQLIACR